MSGGSFYYLGNRVLFGGDWKDHDATLTKMLETCRDLGLPEVADATSEVIAALDMAQERAEKIAKIWQAIERKCSGDSGIEEVREAIEAWKEGMR